MDAYHVTAKWGACHVTDTTEHTLPSLPYTLAAVRDRLTMGATVVEIRRIQERRQAEKQRSSMPADYRACKTCGQYNESCRCLAHDSARHESQAKRERANRQRRERNQAMRDLGLVRVRGNLGGTYWE